MNTIVLIGAGKMGGALLAGWIGNWHRGAAYHVIDPVLDASARHPKATYYIEAGALPSGLKPDIVIIAVKPDKVRPALTEIRPHLAPTTCVVSVAAGVGTDTIGAALEPGTPVARIMPNIGALAGHSVSAGVTGPGVPPETRALLDEMFSAIGQMAWLDKEDDLHIVTAVSGSGPAYVFAFCEALRDAAMTQGIPAAVAQALAIGTTTSAGRLLEDNPAPDALREMVTSPNGTTAAGVAALEKESRLALLLQDTVEAAKTRSIELAGEPEL